MKIDIIEANYHDPQHSADIPFLLNSYACDPMGGGKPLDATVQAQLAATLANVPNAFSVLAYVDGKAAGLANCFQGFSTFACKPLINIHDICVMPEYRGLGLSQGMLKKIEDMANARGCCKITLEVLSNNTTAKSAYTKFGFNGYELDPESGHALFWEKKL